MDLPKNSITLSADEVAALRGQLRQIQHQVCNHTSVIAAAAMLLQSGSHKPEARARATGKLIEYVPGRLGQIHADLDRLGSEFQKAFAATSQAGTEPQHEQPPRLDSGQPSATLSAVQVAALSQRLSDLQHSAEERLASLAVVVEEVRQTSAQADLPPSLATVGTTASRIHQDVDQFREELDKTLGLANA
jgi:hypothetical protein